MNYDIKDYEISRIRILHKEIAIDRELIKQYVDDINALYQEFSSLDKKFKENEILHSIVEQSQILSDKCHDIIIKKTAKSVHYDNINRLNKFS